MLSSLKVRASRFFFCVSDVFPDIRGRLRGETIVKDSLEGTSCGFCKQLPVSTIPSASGNRHGLQPIITQGCPLMGWKCSIGCLPMHTSVDFGLRICTGQAASDSPVCCDVIAYLTASANSTQLLVPLPPTSEQPEYGVVYRAHVHWLDNDSLFQIFNHYRLEHKDNWSSRLRWRSLAHVCQRWRYLVFDSCSSLDVCLFLTSRSRSTFGIRHLPPIPLIIEFSISTSSRYSWTTTFGTMPWEDKEKIRLGLQ